MTTNYNNYYKYLQLADVVNVKKLIDIHSI